MTISFVVRSLKNGTRVLVEYDTLREKFSYLICFVENVDCWEYLWSQYSGEKRGERREKKENDVMKCAFGHKNCKIPKKVKNNFK